MIRSRLILILFCLGLLAVSTRAQESNSAPVILVPVIRNGGPVELPATDGPARPVLKAATESSLTAAIRAVFATPFLEQAIGLERCSRRYGMHELEKRGQRRSDEWRALAEPLYLLLSNEEGGFARRGFWLEGTDGRRRFVGSGYVDLVVDEADVADGIFEEIFAHEMAHVILRNLMGAWPDGPSRKPHHSMAITDYPTAFDGGYAEHFQPLVRDFTVNANLKAFDRGADLTNLNTFWQSSIDRRMRIDGVRRNLFIHEKAISTLALQPNPDRYRMFLDGESSTAYAMDELMNGQQMMASEGVVATIFYRLVNDRRLQMRYRDAAFYEPFLGPANGPRPGKQTLATYENVNLKLFAAMRELARKPLTAERPLMIELIEVYGKLFPDEKAEAYEVLINTTLGATTSVDAVRLIERLAHDGQAGTREFIGTLPEARKFLDGLISEAANDRRSLAADLGPELWVLNERFRIGRSPLDKQRTIPLTINLNTATRSELMTLPSVSLTVASRIVAARKTSGFFRSIDDLRLARVASASLLGALKRMRKAMLTARGFQRQ